MKNVRTVEFNGITDSRGSVIPIEYPKQLDFPLKRVYYIYGVSENERRGLHSHNNLEQVLIALRGSVKILVKTPTEEEVYELNSPDKGLYIGPMIWREMYDFKDDAILFVLASHEYDANDYIRNYDDYEALAKKYFSGAMTIKTKDYNLVDVSVKDADFILKLRLNENLNRFVSPVSNSKEQQEQWIKEYKKRREKEQEFYFKIIDKNEDDIGLVRLYKIDYEKKVCTFGSFILKEDRPKDCSIQSMVAIIKFAFYNLNMSKVILDVRKENAHAINFYERFGFKYTGESDIDRYYEISYSEFQDLYREKYYKFVEVNDES